MLQIQVLSILCRVFVHFCERQMETAGIPWIQAVINKRNTFLLHTIPQNRDLVCLHIRTVYKCPCTFFISRDSVTGFSIIGFFMNQVPPKPQSTPLGPFRIFSKILGDIRSLRCTTGVVVTSAIQINLHSENIFKIFNTFE